MRRGDDGSTHVLEAVIVASIMLSAVAYVATLDPPRSSLAEMDDVYYQKANDFLLTALDQPRRLEACKGNSLLEELMIEGLLQNHARWDHRIDRLLGPSFDANLYVSNGHQRMPLHESHPFIGAGKTVALQPEWSFAHTTATNVTGAESALVDVAATRLSDMVRLRGDAVKYTLTTSNGLGHQAIAAWGATALLDAHPDTAKRQGVASFHWLENGAANITRSIVAATPSQSFILRLQPIAEQIPTGTTATIQFPPDWIIFTVELPSGWQWTEDETTSGTTLNLHRTTAFVGAEDLTIWAEPPTNPTHPFDVIHARLGGGSFGESSLVVEYAASTEHGLPRLVLPTTPYPLRLGSTAFFGVAFANGGETVDVRQVDIEVPGGYDLHMNDGEGAALFADAPLVPAAQGRQGTWARVDAKHLRWTGEAVIEAGKTAWWGVEAVITSDASAATSVEPTWSEGVVSKLRFTNGYEHESSTWGPNPGIIRHRVPPDALQLPPDAEVPDGYPRGVGAQGFTVEATGTRARTQGEGALGVMPLADLVKLQNSVANSTFSVKDRKAALGSFVRVDADLASIVNHLASTGASGIDVRLDVFAPPTVGCGPVASMSQPSVGMPRALIHHAEAWDPAGTGVPDLFVISQDGQAYRINVAAGLVWKHHFGAAPTKFVTVPGGPLEAGLIVADDSGHLTRLRALDGVAAWRAKAGEGGIVALEQDDAGRLLVASFLGNTSVWDASGTRWWQYDHRPPIVQAEWAHDGGAFVATTDRIVSLDAQLQPRAAFDGTWGHFGAFEGGIAVVDGNLLRFMASDFTTLGTALLPGVVSLLSSGDHALDGDEDLVLALADGDFVLVDGTTRAITVRDSASVTGTPDPKGSPIRSRAARACEAALPGDDLVAYAAPDACDFWAKQENPKPLELRIHGGHALMALERHGLPALAVWEPGGSDWARYLPVGRVPSAMSAGAWPGGVAILVGNDDGLVQAIDPATREIVDERNVGDFVGQFGYSFPVPMGGFYGTHIVSATLSWRDSGGVPQSASLMDWFDVVGVDGKPATSQFYRVSVVLQDRGDPFERTGK